MDIATNDREGTTTLPRRAVVLRNLSCVAYGNGLSLWMYRARSLADVLAPGYFEDAVLMNHGDHIMVSADDGGAVFYAGKHGVERMASTGGCTDA